MKLEGNALSKRSADRVIRCNLLLSPYNSYKDQTGLRQIRISKKKKKKSRPRSVRLNFSFQKGKSTTSLTAPGKHIGEKWISGGGLSLKPFIAEVYRISRALFIYKTNRLNEVRQKSPEKGDAP